MREQCQRMKRLGYMIFAFRLIEKFSRLKFDEFLSNKMTDNEPNNLHINKQKKERKKKKTLPLHSVPVLEPSLFAGSHRSWKTKFTL